MTDSGGRGDASALWRRRDAHEIFVDDERVGGDVKAQSHTNVRALCVVLLETVII